MTARRWLALGAAALLLPLTSCGEEATKADDAAPATSSVSADDLEVTGGWVRATTGTDDPTMSAAFMEIENTSDTPVTLLGARTEVAGMVQLHEMVVQDGELVMQPIEGGREIPAGKTAVLEPGFDHVMLMDLHQQLRPGDEVPLTLTFDDGVDVDLVLPVKKFTEEESHYHSDGTEKHSHDASPSATPEE